MAPAASDDPRDRLGPSRFAEIVQRLSLGVHVWRRAPERRGSFELVFANRASEVHTGRRSEEVLGQAIFDAFPQWRGGPLVSLFEDALANGADRGPSELRVAEADGTTSCYSVAVFPITEQSVALSFENTTEQANERAKIERLEHQLLHAQKMEMVGRAAGGIAHDFNNLLTAVLGHSELVLETLPPEHPGRAGLERVQEAGKRAADLTRRLLAVSRHQFSDPELLDLNQIVGEHLSLLRSMVGEDVELRVDLPAEPFLVVADQAQLGQVLLNLVVNGKDAIPGAGKLELATTAREAVSPEGETGSYIALTVTDTGRGMDDDVLARIFDPFFTTKSAEKGTGLGLPTVATIVRDSGGFVEVESEVGRGSRFTVFLPRVRTEPVPALGSAAEIPVVPPVTGATVLVVEDEEMIRTLVADLLSAHGYRVIETANAEEALAESRAHPGTIHLLITDVVMPKTSGVELARQLRESRPDLPVLLTSGYTGETLERSGEAGDAEMLRKPFTPATLLERVAAMIAPDREDPPGPTERT